MTSLFSVYESPVGPLPLSGDPDALTGLAFGDRSAAAEGWSPAPERFADEARQLDEYFAGARSSFDFPLRAGGAPFDRRVWELLLAIPYGTTATYGEIATSLGAADRARAVGAANARNPIAIVVPCHRVIGARGKLTGYGGGIDRKRALLALEGAMLPV